MSKVTRLVDFQVYARPAGPGDAQRSVNEALFATFEAVRLWLKAHEVRAPFRKLVVSLSDESTSSAWHGNVSNALGVCEVTEAIDRDLLIQKAGDHRWVLSVVVHALRCVEQNSGWSSKELDGFIDGVSDAAFPLVHFFEELAQRERTSGLRCVPWLSLSPGETKIGIRLGDRDVTILSRPGPLYLEDSFPVSKSSIREGQYVLVNKKGEQLASVALGDRTRDKPTNVKREE